jgi:transposase
MMVTGVSSIYDFQDSRSGQHAEAFLKDWQGHLVCDDYSGYKVVA